MRTLEEVLAAHPPPFELEILQKEDITTLAKWGRALGDLPVGYGKTVIVTYATLMRGPVLTVVLVPPILIVQWVKWLNSLPDVGRALMYVGSPKHRATLPIEQFDWIVMSYQVFLNDYDRLYRACAGHDVMLAVDEAQAIKGRGKLFDAVRRFSEGRGLFLMTGTPMSKPDDAYAYIKLLTPEVYRNFTHFKNLHVEEVDFFKQPKTWRHLDLLQKNFSLRRVHRTKDEVHAVLPKARYIPVYYELDKEHMALYRRLMEEQLLLLDDGSKIDATTATRLFHYAQQIVTNWGYFAGDPTKVSAVYELIDEIASEINLGAEGASKLILWTQYRMTSAAVNAHMDAMLRPLGRYSVAAYSEVDAKRSIAAFLDDPNAVNLTAQPGSAGAGLNPQYVCRACGFIEVPTTTIPFTQSSGRIDRKGQKHVPLIWILVARGTVQEGQVQKLLKNDTLVADITGVQAVKNLIFPPGN